ncbi:MAG: glycoside hydrolase family protein [Desulfobacula sp.]|jgi:lysozyme|uniref:Lysozyme n=1 Tax=uncultured marine virus TaxID=186617 RepID=A0A0F7L3P2_9VIRU|nr:lysozyme [uncultured marine virus]MBT7628766.1 glycoside hydrolase family protein [Desulfobacula sp.]
MNFSKLEKQLIQHEGERLHPYFCPAGKLSLGIGRNIEDKGISREESRFLLWNDIQESFKYLKRYFPEFSNYPENIQHVMVDMILNLGPGGFLKFRKMIDAIEAQNWPKMAKEMKDSNWYHQVKSRAKNLIKMVNEI